MCCAFRQKNDTIQMCRLFVKMSFVRMFVTLIAIWSQPQFSHSFCLSLCLSHAYYSLFSMLVAIFSVAYSFWTMSHLYNGIAHYFVRFLCTHFPIAIDNTTIHLVERMCMCVLCMFSIFRMRFIRSLFSFTHTHTRTALKFRFRPKHTDIGIKHCLLINQWCF